MDNDRITKTVAQLLPGELFVWRGGLDRAAKVLSRSLRYGRSVDLWAENGARWMGMPADTEVVVFR